MKGMFRIKILSIVFILLSIAAYFSVQEKIKTDTITKDNNKVAIADTASIEKITINKDGQSQSLTKNKAGVWLINNKYEVRGNVINLLLLGLNQLEIKRPVSDAQKNEVLNQLKSKGAKVAVENGDKTITLIFTSNEYDLNTTYLLTEGSNTPYIAYVPGVPGDINNVFKLKENEWRSRDLFATVPLNIQRLKVNYTNDAAGSFEIYFQGGGFFVKEINAIDSTKLDSYLELYRYAPVSGYLLDDSVQTKFQNVKQFASIELLDINPEKSNTIDLYSDPKSKKDYLGKLTKSGESVTVNKEIFDRLLVKKSYFLKK